MMQTPVPQLLFITAQHTYRPNIILTLKKEQLLYVGWISVSGNILISLFYLSKKITGH